MTCQWHEGCKQEAVQRGICHWLCLWHYYQELKAELKLEESA